MKRVAALILTISLLCAAIYASAARSVVVDDYTSMPALLAEIEMGTTVTMDAVFTPGYTYPKDETAMCFSAPLRIRGAALHNSYIIYDPAAAAGLQRGDRIIVTGTMVWTGNTGNAIYIDTRTGSIAPGGREPVAVNITGNIRAAVSDLYIDDIITIDSAKITKVDTSGLGNYKSYYYYAEADGYTFKFTGTATDSVDGQWVTYPQDFFRGDRVSITAPVSWVDGKTIMLDRSAQVTLLQ